jgi:TonB family protein
MQSKKFMIFCISISLASHVVMLSLTGFVSLHGKTDREEVLTIHLKDSSENTDINPEGKEAPNALPEPVAEKADRYNRVQEDTVEIGNADVRYKSYLKKIKQKIENIWTYPQGAIEREEEGITVVNFTISRSGALIETGIITSSGSKSLDYSALQVVFSAAPYDPFPRELNLSRLNIIARFRYKLAE